MKDHHLIAILAGALLLLCAMGIRAGIVVTDQAGPYTRDGVTYETRAACIAAASDGLGADPRTCEQVNRTIVTGSCADTHKPDWTDAQELVQQQSEDGNSFMFWERDYVPAPYPVCWTAGLVPPHIAPTLPNVMEPTYRPAIGDTPAEHP